MAEEPAAKPFYKRLGYIRRVRCRYVVSLVML